MKHLKQYVLMMLNPSFMIENYTVNKSQIIYRYDFFERSLCKRQLIKSISRYSANALFYQLEYAVQKSEENRDENSPMRSLVFLDFHEIFARKGGIQPEKKLDGGYEADDLMPGKCKPDVQLRMLFENGFTLNYGDEEITYVPFDKSGSMARECRISFIDKRLKAEMDERLLLGLDFCNIQAILSKYYAYRGLYLSVGERVESLLLNQETVVILKDERHKVYSKSADGKLLKHRIFRNSEPITYSESEGIKLLEFDTYEQDTVSINLFDGEGLISPAYAEKINDEIGLTAKGKAATSFQIRLPFTKGMLHTVDFQAFFREFGKEGDEPLWIKDYFGNLRDLRKAEIILTKSMFKCADWLNSILEGCKDIPKEYFKRCSQYDHALYISSTDCRLPNNGLTLLNYQFLNTLALQPADFQAMVSRHIDRIPHLSESLLQTEIDAAESSDMQRDDCEDFNHFSKHEEPWMQALRINRNFLRNPKIKQLISDQAIILQKNTALGRIMVEGECRFLSCDLLAMLFRILHKIENLSSAHKSKLKKIRAVKSLYSDCFYLPSPNVKVEANQWFGFLRNPHLSRNEQVLLRISYRSDSLYERYFGKLSGVVMLPQYTTAPLALGGADYDGDMVRVISEPAVVEAIRRAAYTEDITIGNDVHQSARYQRKLPVVKIPDTKELCKGRHISGMVSYDIVRDTFSNSIGKISNLAIRFGAQEYLTEKENLHSRCAECTIVTGLEIDAAKTGAHPTANIAKLDADLKKVKADDSGGFLAFKEEMKELPRYGLKVKQKDGCAKSAAYSVTYGARNQEMLTIRRFSEDDCTIPNLERLPYYYVQTFEAVQKGEQKRKELLTDESVYYQFQDEKGQWRKKLDQQLCMQTEIVMQAYHKVQKIIRDLNEYQKNCRSQNFTGKFYTLLKMQYDSLEMLLPHTGCSVQKSVDIVTAMLLEQFMTAGALQSAIDRMIACDWQFTPRALREERLCEILFGDAAAEKRSFLTKPMVELLSNFSNDGYMLLYYFLKDAINDVFSDISAEAYREYMAAQEETAEEESDSPFFKMLYQEYIQMDSEKYSRDYCQDRLSERCRAELSRIFKGDMDSALRYVFSLRNKADKSEKFLWAVLPADVILRNVRREDANKEGDAGVC